MPSIGVAELFVFFVGCVALWMFARYVLQTVARNRTSSPCPLCTAGIPRQALVCPNCRRDLPPGWSGA
jgi:hypothetical protein